jgi:hypothetical protein
MTRAPATTRAPRPDRRRARLGAAAGALAAAAGLAGCATATEVQVAARTTGAPVATFFSTTGGTGTGGTGGGGTTGGASTTSPATVSPGVSLRPELPPVRGGLVVPFVAVGTPPLLQARPDPCGGFATPRTITPDVAPGPGSAVVSWTADDRPEVQGYRVQAVDTRWASSDQQRPPVVVTAGQRTDCGQVSVTVTGLVRGDTYVFWLDELVASPTIRGTAYEQVGASGTVVVG